MGNHNEIVIATLVLSASFPSLCQPTVYIQLIARSNTQTKPLRRSTIAFFVVVRCSRQALSHKHSTTHSTSTNRFFCQPQIRSVEQHNMSTTSEPVNSTATSSATQTTTSASAMNGTSHPDAGSFSEDLISPTVAAALPEGYRLRSLRQIDYHAGFLECLKVLTTVGDISEEQFADRFEWIRRQDGSYYVLVIEDAGRVVGTGALIVERKLCVTLSPSIAWNTVYESDLLTLYSFFTTSVASTASAWSVTSKISPSQKTSRARNWVFA